MNTQDLITLRKLAEESVERCLDFDDVSPNQGSTSCDKLARNYIAAANPAKVIELLDALEARDREIERISNLLSDAAAKHCADYPNISECPPWEKLHALVQTIEGVMLANEDVHKDNATLRAELAAIRATEDKWEGAEGWEPLAWQLCAEENGEDACSELIWEGGPIPEPWGDRWLKYEDEAKRLIKLVREYAFPVAKDAGLVADGALSVIKRLLKVHEDRSEIDAAALAKAMLESAINDASPKIGGV